MGGATEPSKGGGATEPSEVGEGVGGGGGGGTYAITN